MPSCFSTLDLPYTLPYHVADYGLKIQISYTKDIIYQDTCYIIDYLRVLTNASSPLYLVEVL